jgi:23S rRNA (uridine2552-2'-O)-methyltransferase
MPKPRVLHDEYFKLAKERGYVARSAFKLLEIQEKKRLLRKSDRVLDLGCAPGSWLQVLDQNLGPKAQIAGIDLSPVSAPLSQRVRTMRGDIYSTPPEVLLALGGLSPEQIQAGDKFDAVISDMAPNTSGHGDDFLSARLCERMLDMLPALLTPGGSALMKILEGEPTPHVIARTKQLFREAGTTKPKASRDVSKEIFIWGTGYKPPVVARATAPHPAPALHPLPRPTPSVTQPSTPIALRTPKVPPQSASASDVSTAPASRKARSAAKKPGARAPAARRKAPRR